MARAMHSSGEILFVPGIQLRSWDLGQCVYLVTLISRNFLIGLWGVLLDQL